MVEQLIQKQCISEMSHDESGYFSRVFLVPKRLGGWRPVKVKRVLNTSNFPDGHVREGKGSRRELYVRYVSRPVRCIPAHSKAKRLSLIPMLSSQRQKVHHLVRLCEQLRLLVNKGKVGTPACAIECVSRRGTRLDWTWAFPTGERQQAMQWWNKPFVYAVSSSQRRNHC